MTRERVDISIPGKPGSLKTVGSPADTPRFAGGFPRGAKNVKSALTCGMTKPKKGVKMTRFWMILTHLHNPRSESRACQNDTPLHDSDTPKNPQVRGLACQNDTLLDDFDTPAKTGACHFDTCPRSDRVVLIDMRCCFG